MSVKSQVTDRDTGFKEFIRRAKAIKGSYTQVGVQEGATRDDDNSVSDMVMVAAANEFGTDKIPERSFLRSSYEENKEEIARMLKAEHAAVLRGKDPIQSLRQVGQWFAAKVIEKIHSHPPPPNKPATIARKGSSGTLVDSGQLAQSIRSVEVVK